MGWFLSKVLLNKWNTWAEAIKRMPIFLSNSLHEEGSFSIDVLRAPDISIEEHLLLCNEHTPLVYQNGEFKRPVDFIRRYSRAYRGSFNPVTISHESIGHGSMFEISLDNVRKGSVELSDVVHRVKMLDLVGRPTLITSRNPLFVDLHKSLLNLGAGSMEYILGVDTFNAVVDEKYIDQDNELFFEDFDSSNSMQSARFVVVPRADCKVTSNEHSEKVSWKETEVEFPEVSSSAVRSGNLEFVSSRVRKYILDNNLYS